MSDDDSLLLPSTKTCAFNTCIPRSVNGSTLQNPQESKNGVGKYEKDHGALQRSDQSFARRDQHEEQAYRDFGPHQSRKSLDPFPVSVFGEFLQLVVGQVVLMPSEAVVHLGKVQCRSDDRSELEIRVSRVLPVFREALPFSRPYQRKKNGPIVPADLLHDPNSSGESQRNHDDGDGHQNDDDDDVAQTLVLISSCWWWS